MSIEIYLWILIGSLLANAIASTVCAITGRADLLHLDERFDELEALLTKEDQK
ncbi:hypothetical protein [Streptomyces sp. WZ-12]|uniref:hypothetical protein n=1 Tax=Streptomyces sp. WZ-12 TaxID=3030210 RepID=UPI0023816FB1|nr:hypothetical protein [Streptomyces sp. WZ-12]